MDALRSLAVPTLLAFAACGAPPPAESPAPASENPKPAVAPSTVKRLPIADFSELPASVAAFLEKRECTIPQADSVEGQSNVISGEFFETGVRTWAALCSRDGRSIALVFRDPDDRDPAALASIADNHCANAQQPCSFAANIQTVDPELIRQYDREVSGLTPPPIQHQGIEIVQPGEPAVVRYFHDGQWLELLRLAD
ncbi:MAG: hypothetical protein R2748_29210 [Bryobacterales bacterium]